MAGVKSRIPRVQPSKGPSGRLGNLNPLFQKQTAAMEASQISPLVVKQARKSGKVNLSGKNLSTVPERIWTLDTLDENEIKSIDVHLSDSVREDEDSKWWEHEPLTLLDLSNNCIATLSPKIKYLASLTNLLLQHNSFISLPKEIGQLRRLKILNLSHNKLSTFPEGIFELKELRQLNISFNLIEDTTDSIGDLNMLEKLDLSHNRLTVLSPGVGFLTHLTHLLAMHNAITDVPPDVGNLRVLRELDLSHNAIPLLPPMGELKKLEIFRAEHNNITDIPDFMGCSSLREIHLSGNCISELSESALEALEQVRVLSLRDNKLENIPEEVSYLKNLIRLDIGNNGIRELPPCLSLLPHLSTLTLDGNPLKTLRTDVVKGGTTRVLKVLRGQLSSDQKPSMNNSSPSLPGLNSQPWPNKYNMNSSRALKLGLRELTTVPDSVFEEAVKAEVTCVDLCKNLFTQVPQGISLVADFLTELNLSNNKLTALPDSLITCKKLQYLEVSQNALTDLPASFDAFEQLREINLSFNRFESIPSCLFGLPAMEILIARDNKIKEIDTAGLASIPRLATLDLSNNDIGSVPPQLGLLKLHCLELAGNSFKVPRQNILCKGTPSILSYLRDRLPK
ncbi:leucine-rich repeat-containing protein 40-like [Neocloeon triangulifer]|uniref:leucine-rich repeat-containing protein 40-like n=1 Tax=Neocloeon triangulifer TaxID=2078957 RepID=UPI00286F7E0A|nr:leucine-rich repeat-containing protein 40-like [Neocloeon triangulifer]